MMAHQIISRIIFINHISEMKVKMCLRSFYNSRLNFSTSCRVEDSHKIAPSIDDKNFQQFKNHSRDWWDIDGKRKGLHTMNFVRVPFIRDGLAEKYGEAGISETLKSLKLLDVGCGGGILTEALANFSANVTGIDPSAQLISIAQEHVSEDRDLAKRVTYHTDSIENHAVKYSEKYDVVILSEVIEHVNEQEAFLKFCIDAVKPGGSIFLSTFNKTALSYLWGIILMEYVFRTLPKKTHEWSKFISPEETQKIFEKNNCKVVQGNGLLYYPWNNSWNWSKTNGVTYIQHAVKNKN